LWTCLPPWVPPPRPLLVISPHPDDETLSIGGLIAHQRSLGIDVTLVAVTDGEKAYGHDPAMGLTRCDEQASAAQCLGIRTDRIQRLHLPDSGLEACENEIKEAIARFVSPGMVVVAPWRGDFHPDHKVCGHVAERIASTTGVDLISYFFWTWHTERVESVQGLPLRRFDLDPQSFAKKKTALAEHRSQLAHSGEPPILTEPLLWPARVRMEVYLPW
jgi:LmbE family N-acetylglucosaminyl deacetylase